MLPFYFPLKESYSLVEFDNIKRLTVSLSARTCIGLVMDDLLEDLSSDATSAFGLVTH